MTQVWMLFSLLVLTGGQIIYPDQYEMMISTTSPNAYNNGVRISGSAGRPALQAGSNSQPAQVDQQLNQQSATQFSDTGPPAVQPLYPSTTPTNLESALERDWNNYVSICGILFACVQL